MRRIGIVAAAQDAFYGRVPRRPLAGALLAVGLGIIIGGTAAFWVFPVRALAATCSPSSSPHYQVDARSGAERHGVRVYPGMYVYNQTPVCAHVSSIGAVDPNTGEQVEVGWQDILNGLTWVAQQCTIQGDGTPHAFRTKTRDGTFYCTNYGQITTGVYDGFAVDDQNGDDNWTFWHGGSQLGSNPVPMDFSVSWPVTNGERYSDSESAQAYFNGMQYMPLNGSWSSWDSSNCYGDTDPTYNNRLLSPVTVQVAAASQLC